MSFIRGEGRTQGTLFPVTLEDLIPEDHICRVIDAFVDRLNMAGLEFERADPADTGRPGYDPRERLERALREQIANRVEVLGSLMGSYGE